MLKINETKRKYPFTFSNLKSYSLHLSFQCFFLILALLGGGLSLFPQNVLHAMEDSKQSPSIKRSVSVGASRRSGKLVSLFSNAPRGPIRRCSSLIEINKKRGRCQDPFKEEDRNSFFSRSPSEEPGKSQRSRLASPSPGKMHKTLRSPRRSPIELISPTSRRGRGKHLSSIAESKEKDRSRKKQTPIIFSLQENQVFYTDVHILTEECWRVLDLSDRLKKWVILINKQLPKPSSEPRFVINLKENSEIIDSLKSAEGVFSSKHLNGMIQNTYFSSPNPNKIINRDTKCEVLICSEPNAKIVIKKFHTLEKGLEELWHSLVALSCNPSPQILKMTRIYDAFISNHSNCLNIVMEGARKRSVAEYLAYFMHNKHSTKNCSSEDIIKATATYLAKFHMEYYLKCNFSDNKTRERKYLQRAALYFNSLSYNSITQEDKSVVYFFSLLPRARIIDIKDEDIKAYNIIQLLPKHKQEQFIRFVKKISRNFEKNSKEIYRSLQNDGETIYPITTVHGDATMGNFLYNSSKKLKQNGHKVPSDSHLRVSTTDFATLVMSYGNTSDLGQDVGRAKGALAEILAKNDQSNKIVDEIRNFQVQFETAYLNTIQKYDIISSDNWEKFKKMFKNNSDHHELNIYRVICNSKQTKEVKLSLLESWLQRKSSEEEASKNVHHQSATKPQDPDELSLPHYVLPEGPKNFIKAIDTESNKSYLSILKEKFPVRGASDDSRIIRLKGMGGIGKTCLALKYAHQIQHHYALIYWLPSSTDSTLIKAYKNLLSDLRIPINNIDNEYLIEFSKIKIEEYLSHNASSKVTAKGRCLLIYDNVPSADFLKDKTPETFTDILITSRDSSPPTEECLVLDNQRFASAEYLHKNLNLINNSTFEKELAHISNNWPLGLAYHLDYIKLQYGENPSVEEINDYLQKLKNNPYTHFKKCINPFREEDLDHKTLIFWGPIYAFNYLFENNAISNNFDIVMKNIKKISKLLSSPQALESTALPIKNLQWCKAFLEVDAFYLHENESCAPCEPQPLDHAQNKLFNNTQRGIYPVWPEDNIPQNIRDITRLGHPRLQYAIGRCFFDGLPGSKPEEAAAYFKLAITEPHPSGHPPCKEAVSLLYQAMAHLGGKNTASERRNY